MSAIVVINAVYPTLGRSSGAVVSAAGKMDDRIKSQISIIQATGELDADGVWQDTNSNGYFDIFTWVKNVGAATIDSIGECDVFFGETGDFNRIPYVDYAGGGYPNWSYEVENATDWDITGTVKITISYSAALSSGTYKVKVIIPNGISHEHTFSI